MATKSKTPKDEISLQALPFRRQGYAALVQSAEVIIEAVAEAMAILLPISSTERTSVATTSRLAQLFRSRLDADWLRAQVRDDHLTRGLATAWGKTDSDGAPVVNERSRHVHETPRPRLIDLLLLHITEAEEHAKSGKSKGVLIPSPAQIALAAMTAPDALHTQAYAIIAIRTVLCQRFQVWPVLSEGESGVPEQFFPLTEFRISREIDAFNTYLSHGDNYFAKDPTKKFIAHFIAARGPLRLRFSTQEGALEYLRHGDFASSDQRIKDSQVRFPEFRLADDKYPRLPDAASFANELLGVSLPLRGADTVFFNGLKFSSNTGRDSSTNNEEDSIAHPSRSLVIGVSGDPGSGKTSFGLALAAALAPMDTQTTYLTFEEDPKDLQTKLITLNQSKVKKVWFAPKKSNGDEIPWFSPHRLEGLNLYEFENSILSQIAIESQDFERLKAGSRIDRTLVTPIPLLVVVDSISALSLDCIDEFGIAPTFNEARCTPTPSSQATKRKRLEAFVKKCRSMGALVVLLSASKTEFSGVMEYLVDIVINLNIENATDHTQKPLRLLTLSKSRHQMARHGTHVMHLSKEAGFRIAPQLPSQMDARHSLKHLLWDPNRYIDVLNIRRNEEGFSRESFLNLHTRSQILIHGRGSSGKAGLALKMAFAPRFKSADHTVEPAQSRVLVISFLYPEEYYETLKRRIFNKLLEEKRLNKEAGDRRDFLGSTVLHHSKTGYIHFSPGFLAPEDLYSKVVRSLDRARLEGSPYSVVVIDGLHNLALQYPGARDSNVLWPIVFGTLVRSNVTTISTFTTLALTSRTAHHEVSTDAQEDSVFRLRSHLPLLHALVQASDYVLEVEKSKDGKFYDVGVLSAINTEPPINSIKWDRKELEFVIS